LYDARHLETADYRRGGLNDTAWMFWSGELSADGQCLLKSCCALFRAYPLKSEKPEFGSDITSDSFRPTFQRSALARNFL